MKEEPKAPNRSQAQWGIAVEVKLNDCCHHITSTSQLSTPKVTLLSLFPFLDISFAGRGSRWREKWESEEKSLNPMSETGEGARETTENILTL